MSETPASPARLGVGMITVDCDDPGALSAFWRAALGLRSTMETPDFVILGGHPALAFQRVEAPTPGKNRLHLDLAGGERAAEVARLVELGAVVVRHHDVDGFCWTVLTDPAGNEFCVSDPHD